MGTIHLTRIPVDRDFQILDLFIDGNGQGDHRDLVALRLPSDFDRNQGVVLNGKGPLWLHTWAMQQCRHALWLAVMDPRHGAIVVRSHDGGPEIASVIPFERIAGNLPRREPAGGPGEVSPSTGERVIAFVGPPHSGKSVLIHALHETLREVLPAETFQRDVFLLRACPDGEGNWFGEIPPDRAAILRFKSHWDEDFVAGMVRQIEGLVPFQSCFCGCFAAAADRLPRRRSSTMSQHRLVTATCIRTTGARKSPTETRIERALAATKRLLLVDCGGRIDRRMQRILAGCNAAVIVSRDAEATAEWRGALLASGIDVVAEIESVLAEARDVSSGPPLRVRLGPLERGKRVANVPVELVRAVVGS